MKIKKKNILFILILTLIIFAIPLTCYAESWYVCRNKNEQPKLDSTLSIVNNYDGVFYVDRNATEENKVIYLTFDAGYENGNVEKILDIMKEHNAKGAFFVLDNLIIKETELVKRMAQEGHLVCNHTAKHNDMSKITNKTTFVEKLTALEDIYCEYIGQDMPKIYRPPEGKFSKQNLEWLEELGYKTIFWSFAYADWDNNKQPSEDFAISKIKENTHNGMIILLHPTSSTNANIMDRLLTMWENEGYRFGSLDELK